MNPFHASLLVRKSLIFIVPVCIGFGLLSYCTDQVTSTVRFHRMTPVYTTTQEIREAVAIMPPRAIQGTGKIFSHDNYLFLNQPGEGVHIIDNTNPSQPQTTGFINIPGNYDLAVAGDIMYADSYIDLLAIDISNHQSIQVLHREENVFPKFNSFGFYSDNDKGVVTQWEEVDVTETFEGELNGTKWGPGVYQYIDHLGISQQARHDFVQQSNVPIRELNSTAPTPVGRGGSMSRFAISTDHLYTIDDENMQVFDLSSATTPTSVNEFSVGFMIETIYAHQKQLFVGAQNAMYIYDKSVAASPNLQATYWHATSCDPVIANDTMAYVTLRTGTTCEGDQNVLELVDIKQANLPQEVARYNMDSPHGLGLDEHLLFVCEGASGVKVFDARYPYALDNHLISQIDGLFAYDVITQDQHLIVIAEDGVYQYDYTNPEQITLLSKMTRAAL
ncbi:LVIVD repeat-containing protein [Tunicatimonas pelagia]|uniref:LVIVD repeat-containing protein n=1 Tax=Tunicatimonas pelagia TaxID=931531 RepID=UPI002666D24D|nr:hypothetical protein [Tunicatimonas pelagia]WKN43419.1 hypothetical protein P0M28_00345 [Tunicatimonas pelagia]